MAEYIGPVDDLVRHAIRDGESRYVEFKSNNRHPEVIGKTLSALSNGAALDGADFGLMIWGVSDRSEIVGTSFDPRDAKKGNQSLEMWLAQLLEPNVSLEFLVSEDVAVARIGAAAGVPTSFARERYVRRGSHNVELQRNPDLESLLFKRLEAKPFETASASPPLSQRELLHYLDVLKLLDLEQQILDADGATRLLLEHEYARREGAGRFSITNLGALLFAKDLNQFPHLADKAWRVAIFDEHDVNSLTPHDGQRGYAAGFQGLLGFVLAEFRQPEQIEGARRSASGFPEVALRELLANAVVHQDLLVGGGPIVEVRGDRVIISNPGRPLIPTDHFLNAPPKARNQLLGRKMRAYGFCEELGTGIDRAVSEIEALALPAPEFETWDDSLKVTLFAERDLSRMTRKQRRFACYWHACLKWSQEQQSMTNASFRERLGLSQKQYTTASQIIRDALDEGLIKKRDPESKSRKHAQYVPIWV